MIKSQKTYKIVKRDRDTADSEENKEDEMVLVRIKRSAAMRDDVEELQLEMGKDGSVKRQKLITQNEVLVRNFNQKIGLNTQKPAFTLDIKPQQPVVTLRRLIGKDETEVRKQARDRLLNETRKQKREEMKENRRI